MRINYISSVSVQPNFLLLQSNVVNFVLVVTSHSPSLILYLTLSYSLQIPLFYNLFNFVSIHQLRKKQQTVKLKTIPQHVVVNLCSWVRLFSMTHFFTYHCLESKDFNLDNTCCLYCWHTETNQTNRKTDLRRILGTEPYTLFVSLLTVLFTLITRLKSLPNPRQVLVYNSKSVFTISSFQVISSRELDLPFE